MKNKRTYSMAKEFTSFSRKYPFSLRQLICTGIGNYCGNIACNFRYYYTTICVSISRTPHFINKGGVINITGDCCDEESLVISLHDHTDCDPKYKLPLVTQYQLLFCLGMIKSDESPDGLITYKNPSPFYPKDPETVYYVRPLSECAVESEQLRDVYLRGTMSIEEMWAATQRAAGAC